MNSKEEALLLVTTFGDTFDKYYRSAHKNKLPFCKQCALITVEKLIKESGLKYWYEVKKEIELL